ncbi:condensation domain-containing protein, partial [Pseudomonas asplenii]|uniref:condensation domain-containing protein n=2 Tax=Pseudomonas TaxID=286 RepID=UPI0006CD6B04
AAGAGDAQVQAFVLEHGQAPFDLRNGPLMRAALLRVADDEHVLVLTLHHIVADGWSLQVMIEELVQGYQSLSQGLTLELPALPIQ